MSPAFSPTRYVISTRRKAKRERLLLPCNERHHWSARSTGILYDLSTGYFATTFLRFESFSIRGGLVPMCQYSAV
jgi:hypothetical protein